MSKLDEILKARLVGYPEAQEIAKQQIKDLMLELIGDNEEQKISSPPFGFSNPKFDLSAPRNNLKDELRQKVEEL